MGMTIIYISHYMEEVEEICSRVLIMDHGKVIANGTKDELKSLVSDDEKISIEVSSINYTIVEKIKEIPNVKDCVINGNKITVTSVSRSKNLSKIIECILNGNSDIISLNCEKPTLENVFLTLTGKSLRD